MVAGPPCGGDLTAPPAVDALAAGRPVRTVWQNELGGLTFEVGAGGAVSERCFVKWAPLGSGLDLDAEAWRMTWAAAYTPVPRVLDIGADETGSWLVTTPLRGETGWPSATATPVNRTP